MRLKELRKRRKLTQQEVADAIGIERALYVRYENGSRNPPVGNLKKLADFFEVSIDYLIERTDDPSIENDTYGTSRSLSLIQQVVVKAMDPATHEDGGKWTSFMKDFGRLDADQQDLVLKMMQEMLRGR